MTTKSTFGRVGLLTLAIFFIIAVSLSNLLLQGIRLDLTENRLYTLSGGTENILAGIEEPINLYFFYSDRATANIPYLRTYAGRVKETLQEFVQQSEGKLRLSIIDPLPFSEDEDRASELGLQGIALQAASDPVYLGIAGTNSVGDEEIIAFLDPSKESFLEYDLAKLVHTLATPERPVIGLITDLPMTAGFDPRTQQMSQPWLITSEIRSLFELRTLSTSVTAIDSDIDVLLVVHPKSLTDAALYAIDQFILRGGRALLAVDPFAEIDMPAPDPANPSAALTASRSSTLNPLLSAWGVTVSPEEVVADDRYALTVAGFGARPIRHIGLIGVDERGIDAADVVTSGIRNLNFGFAGFISVTEDGAATVTPLIESSDLAAPVPAATLQFMQDPSVLRNGFAPTGERYTIAARLQGTVPTAFPDGPSDQGALTDTTSLKESVEPVNVILLADVDMFSDRLWAQVQNFFGQQLTTAFAGNGNFVVNALDNLTGSGDLISIRGRETYTRPFTRVEDLRREAEDRFRQKEQQLQLELEETEARLQELQASREDSNVLILSDEQGAELERFQEERLRIRKELRQVRRDLDKSIAGLGTWLKVINIGLMPLVVSLISIALLMVARRRKAAS